MIEGTASSRVAYCDFTRLQSRLEVQAWIKPLDGNVWIALSISVILCAMACCLKVNQTTRYFLRLDVSEIAGSTLILAGLILHQYSSINQRSLVFTSFALATLTVGALYESEITIEILKPMEPRVINNLAELIHEKKYRLWLLAKTEMHKEFELAYLNNHLSLIKKGRLLTGTDVVFFNNSDSSLFGSKGMGDKTKRMAMLDQSLPGTEPDLLSILRNEMPAMNCHYVERPVGTDLFLIMFGNVMGLKQIKVFKSFISSGLTEFWKRLALSKLDSWLRMSRRLVIKEVKQIEEDNVYIELQNLISILILWGALLAIAFCLLIFEIILRCISAHNYAVTVYPINQNEEIRG
jgi:hypothetical protein